MSRPNSSVLLEDVQQAQVPVELQKPAAVGEAADVDRGEAEGFGAGRARQKRQRRTPGPVINYRWGICGQVRSTLPNQRPLTA